MSLDVDAIEAQYADARKRTEPHRCPWLYSAAVHLPALCAEVERLRAREVELLEETGMAALGRTAVELFDEAKRRQGEVYFLRRELLTLSETLSATTIMATARRLRELGDGA